MLEGKDHEDDLRVWDYGSMMVVNEVRLIYQVLISNRVHKYWKRNDHEGYFQVPNCGNDWRYITIDWLENHIPHRHSCCSVPRRREDKDTRRLVYQRNHPGTTAWLVCRECKFLRWFLAPWSLTWKTPSVRSIKERRPSFDWLRSTPVVIIAKHWLTHCYIHSIVWALLLTLLLRSTKF